MRILSVAAALLLAVCSPVFAQGTSRSAGGLTASSLAVTPIMTPGAFVGRTLAQHFGDHASVLDYGASCDGITDDSSAIVRAGASGRRIIVPDGLTCNAPEVAQAAMVGVFIGGGQVKGSDGYQRGPQYGAVRVAPNSVAWNQAASQADNCSGSFQCWAKFDYSHTLSAEEYHISGAATLGQPVHNYQTMPGASPHSLFFDNASGWNQSHNSNDGRTGTAAVDGVIQNNGGGDFGYLQMHVQCSGYVPPGDGNTTPGPDGSIINGYTDWLAVPGCGFIGATLDAYNPGQYLQIGEFPIEDNGNDVSAIGWEEGYRRTATTAKINNRWIHELTTCNAGLSYTLPCDAHTQLGGAWYLGFTTIGATVTAPVAMSANQKIILNGSQVPAPPAVASPYAEGAPPLKWNLGGDWITSDGSGVVIAQNGSTAVRAFNNPGAVNYVQLAGSVSGSPISVAPAGTDAAIGALVQDKGGAGVGVLSNGSLVAKFISAVASTGYLNVTAGTPSAPLMLEDYSAGNQDMALQAAGTGLVRLLGEAPATLVSDSSSAIATTAMVHAALAAPFPTLTVAGHLYNTGPAPTVAAASAGACALVPGSSDHRGSVTIAAGGPTLCQVNWSTAYAAAPFCVLGKSSPGVDVGIQPYPLNAAINLAAGAPQGLVVTWHCEG